MPFGKHGFYAPPGEAPLPYGKPGPMTDAERFLFETCGVSQSAEQAARQTVGVCACVRACVQRVTTFRWRLRRSFW